jgi:hypothetical protein
MELENIILSEVNPAQKTKYHSPSYADFRSRAKGVMLLDLGHMQGESTYRRNGDR